MSLRTLHLFAGGGGGILADMLLGHVPVCAVEIEPYCREVLNARQMDGMLPPFPIFEDVCTFDGTAWRGRVDCVSGGFPCQDISTAGKGAGIDGARSGLWGEFARIIREVGPRYVFVENSPALTSRGLGRVLGDLASLGLNAEWTVLGADDVGAPHRRKRIWILAYSSSRELRDEPGRLGWSGGAGETKPRDDGAAGPMAHASSERFGETRVHRWDGPEERPARSGATLSDSMQVRLPPSVEHVGSDPMERTCGIILCQGSESALHAESSSPAGRWTSGKAHTESGLGRVAHGLAHGLDWSWPPEPADIPRVAVGTPKRAARLKALGNGQVPLCAAVAWRILYARAHEGLTG